MTTATAPSTHPLVDKQAEVIAQATQALADRSYFSRFPESPSPRVYGEGSAEAGQAAYEASAGQRVRSGLGDVRTDGDWVGEEVSPYGPALGITYPHLDLDAALAAAADATPAWRDAGARTRAAVCVEIVEQINARSFEIAHSVMHTTGQPFVMAFQAAGPHAQDRALESIVAGLVEQERVPRLGRLGEARPRQGGQPRAAADAEGLPRRAAWRRPRHRLQHLPDVERLPRPVRLARDRQPRHRQAAPAGRAPARHLRGGVPRGAGRGRLQPRPGPARARGRGRGPGQGARRARRGPDHRLHRRPDLRRVARGDTARPAASSSTPRRPASTRSSSTRPTTCAGCSATWPSRSPSTPARCARPRRTSTSPATASTTDEGHALVRGLRRRSSPRRSAS